MSLAALLAVVVLVVLAGIPRFASSQHIDVDRIRLTDQVNGWFLDYEDPDVDISGYSFDVYSYLTYVEYLRGDFDRYPIYGPWRWRAVPSVIAAQVPIEEPAVAFAAVSLGFAVIGAACVVLVVAGRRRGPLEQFVAGAIYAVSFPMLWYGTSGYVDGSLVATLAVALLFIEKRWWWAFLALVPVGMMVKETFLIAIAVAAVRLWADARRERDTQGWDLRSWLPVTGAAAALAVGTFVAARILWTTPRSLGWIPRLSRFTWNLSRPQALGSFILTCGVVLPLAAVEIRRLWQGRDEDGAEGGGRAEWLDELHLVVGVGMGLLVALHGFATAYSDGRHVWTIYPFAAVLGAHTVSRWWDARRAPASPAVADLAGEGTR